MTKPPVTTALVGCGAVSELYYAPSLAALPGGTAEVVAVFDPIPSHAAKLLALFPRAKVAQDLSQLIEIGPQLAIVASPPQFHAQQSITLLEAGIGVLCEKPMAGTVADAEKMIAAAAKSVSPLAIGLFRRFFPVNRMIRDIIKGQQLGEVERFEITEGGAFQWLARSASFFQKSGSQGGVLADLGVHVLDLLIWWFGMPETVVYEDDAMGGLEANCRVELTFAGGMSGTVRLSRDTELPNRSIVECQRGWLRCEAAAADRVELGFLGVCYSVSGSVVPIESWSRRSPNERMALSYHQSFTRQLQNVIAAVRGDESLELPGSEGLPSLRLIEECYRNRRLMPMPWLAPDEFASAVKAQTGDCLV